MNKTELIQEIADKANASKSDAQKFFDAFTDVVESELKKGNQVQITGFGKFYVQKRDARQGINPQTKQRINIPASKVPKFTAGNALKDSIK
jgi:DNA-binding protein HU-beta